MRILKETELRKVKVLGSGAFGTVYKVSGGAIVWAGGRRGYLGGSQELGTVVSAPSHTGWNKGEGSGVWG